MEVRELISQKHWATYHIVQYKYRSVRRLLLPFGSLSSFKRTIAYYIILSFFDGIPTYRSSNQRNLFPSSQYSILIGQARRLSTSYPGARIQIQIRTKPLLRWLFRGLMNGISSIRLIQDRFIQLYDGLSR